MRPLKYAGIALLALAALALGIRLLMPVAARRLVRSDRLVHADAIVVLGSGRVERSIEAGTLFREGWSGRILILRSPDIANRGLLKKLNLRVPVMRDIQLDVLDQMGVPDEAIDESSVVLNTTRAEVVFIGEYVRRNGFKRVIVVTSPYHTARAGRYLARGAGKSFTVIMRPNRYEPFDPDHWWQLPPDRHDVVFEYLKLVFGFIDGVPFFVVT